MREAVGPRGPSEPPLADWLMGLSHDGPFERSQAGDSPPPLTAVPSLLSLLSDDNSEVRRRAIRALGDLGAEARRVLPALRAALRETALHDGDEGARGEALRALLRAGPQPPAEVAALVESLRSDVDVVRFHAAVALGESGADGRAAVPALIHASLWDEEPAVRVEAARALWRIDRRAAPAVYALTRALGDANELVCWIAAECLGQMGPAARDAVPALWQALRRDFKASLVKAGVRIALEQIDPQAAAGAS
jgi:HEAT repeat protein